MPSEQSRPVLTGRLGRPPWWLVGLAAVVLALATVDVVHHGVLTRVDKSVSHRMMAWDLRHDAAKPLIYLLTLPGQRWVVLLVTGALVAYLGWRGRTTEPVLRWLVAIVALTVAVYALKSGVAREAPAAIAGRPNPTDSYPSGHVANAVLLWTTVAWCAARAPVVRWLPGVLRAVAVVGPIAVIVGMTLLDYHWVSDFLAGVCVGIILLPLALAPYWSTAARHLDRVVRRHEPGPPGRPPVVDTSPPGQVRARE